MQTQRERMNETHGLNREAEAARLLVDTLKGADDPELTHDMIEAETGFMECLDQILFALAEDEAILKGASEMAKCFQARAQAAKRRIDYRKAAIEAAIIFAELDGPIRRVSATLALRRNPPSLGDLDESRIPTQFFIQQAPKLDRRKLLEVLKEGESVPGAGLGPETRSLQIRRA